MEFTVSYPYLRVQLRFWRYGSNEIEKSLEVARKLGAADDAVLVDLSEDRPIFRSFTDWWNAQVAFDQSLYTRMFISTYGTMPTPSTPPMTVKELKALKDLLKKFCQENDSEWVGSTELILILQNMIKEQKKIEKDPIL